MELLLWELLCALALVKSAIKSLLLKMIFNDVLNSKLSKLRSFAFGLKLVRPEGFFLLCCKKTHASYF